MQTCLLPGGFHPYQPNPVSAFLGGMPYEFMPQMPQLGELESAALRELLAPAKAAQEEDWKRRTEDIDPGGYHFTDCDAQLALLRGAGLTATTLWQKREFVLFLGLKPAASVDPSPHR